MFYKAIKPIMIMLLGMFFASCSKHEMHSGHSCCTKENTPVKKAQAQTTANSKNSIYRLAGTWTNQDGSKMQLNRLKGKTRLVAMIFTHCGYACPKMVSNMKAIENALPRTLKDKTGFVLVSFDPQRDSAVRLKQYAEMKQLGSRWTLLHGSDHQVRMLSMLLQLQYDRLPDGNFNHSNILTLLDDNGNIVQQFEGLDIETEKVVKAVERSVK